MLQQGSKEEEVCVALFSTLELCKLYKTFLHVMNRFNKTLKECVCVPRQVYVLSGSTLYPGLQEQMKPVPFRLVHSCWHSFSSQFRSWPKSRNREQSIFRTIKQIMHIAKFKIHFQGMALLRKNYSAVHQSP